MQFSKKSSLLSVLTVLSSLTKTIKADCTLSSDGNYYCAQTDAIIYSNVGLSSTYLDVTNMDESSCACTQSSTSFSGSLAPLDEELSVHFRGPLNLKQFGVYYPASTSSLKKRDNTEEECDEIISTKAAHQHKRDVAVEYVEVTSTVWVDANGNVASSNAASATAYTEVSTVINQKSSTKTSSTASSTSTTATASTGDWVRASYYTPGSTTNCTILNHMGGTAGSGVWSSCFGNSISFAAEDGVSGAGSATALGDVTIASGKEFMIFSGDKCSGTSDCDYYRSDIPAYHGFSGDSKIFVFEFQMPSDTDGTGYNQDMPAIWLLNAKIPRTLQYGSSECSCWETGCGEMDLFEILSAGSDKLISHVHDGQGGGSQDYFARPVSSTLKAAVIFNGSDKTIHIVEVDDDFSSTLSSDTVNSWLNTSGSSAVLP